MLNQLLAPFFDADAEDYERTCVPLFRPLVKKLLQLYDARPRSRVLDAGTGTGLAATLVAPRVGREGRVLGVDVSAARLAIAREKARRFGFVQCEFQPGDITALEFPDGDFDLVICSLVRAGDPNRLFVEFRRVCPPGHGALLCQQWSASRSEAERAYQEALAQFRTQMPDEALAGFRAVTEQVRRDWEWLAAPADYERLARDAGWAAVEARREPVTARHANAEAYVEWRSLQATTRAEVAALPPERRAEFREAAARALRPFESEHGLVFDSAVIQLVAHA